MATLATHSLRPSNSSQSVRNVSSASTSSSRSKNAGGSNNNNAPLTVDAALTHANGNPTVALETVVAERNMLSSQNAQLWKLIEKQRSVMKELDRVRAERDRAVAKLGEGANGLSSSAATRIRPSPSAPSTTTMVTTPSEDSDAATAPSRPRGSRHHSSDVRAPSTDSSKGSSSRPAPQRHQSEPHQQQDLSSQPQTYPVPQLSLTTPPSTIVLEPSPTMSTSLNPMTSTTTTPAKKRFNRESRISLPDEASRYIASMVDSPVPSPRGIHSHSQPSPAISDDASPMMGNSDSRIVSSSPEVELPAPTPAPPRVPSPAEEMYAESIISISSRRDVDESPFEDAAEILEEASPIEPHPSSQRIDEPMEAAASVDGGESVTNSPPPPPPLQIPSDSASVVSAITTPSASSTTLARDRDRDPSPTTESSTRSSQQLHHQDSRMSFPPPGAPSAHKPAQFKSTRLTVADLPYTKIKIHGSNIKTNERGKEVLSFLLTVYPGGDGEPLPNANPLKKVAPMNPAGMESWVVEKLYSEILALDGNVRSKLGKTGGKKLAPLPDGKLFKDHAPAKADARKAILETYMQSLVGIPLKNKNEICMFLSTDLVRGNAVMNADHKEGYLTKRGKNFGGWKTRYFVLQSPVLEYYESRGGQHLGSIAITGAQIGRQQKNTASRESDDENSYRHAFLIIENKKGPGGSSVRHVLCAETDEERDAWVELLVKYVVAGQAPGAKSSLAYETDDLQNRNSTSTAMSSDPPLSGPNGRISIDPLRWGGGGGGAAPKPSMDSFSESASIASASGFSAAPTLASRPNLERSAQSPDVPLSSSLPDQQPPISSGSGSGGNSLHGPFNPPPPRANSEQGHYPETLASPSNGDVRASPSARVTRASFHPSHALKAAAAAAAAASSSMDRAASPEKDPSAPKVKISGPINGAPIPMGAKFGNDPPPPPSSNDRERKAKSGRFWGFGRTGNGTGPPAGLVPRAVFGVPLEVSLAVAQIAELPAVVFRCIEYLESKNAEQEEGIYRLSGSSNVIKNLKERFNMEGDVDLLKSDEFWDPHAIAGLLKTFLRDLPNSILTRELHLRFLGVIDLANQEERIQELASLVSQLPLPNYGLLRALTAHLILIVQNSNINKMTMRNVGIVFSPTLGIPAGVFGLMLGEFERVFNVDGAAEDAPEFVVDGLDVDVGDISNRNSRSYADGAADKMLGLAGRKLGATDEESDDTDDEIAESSGTETENDTQDTSPPNTPGPNTYTRDNNSGGSDNGGSSAIPASRSVAHSASVAAQRGLQVSVAAASNGRRTSGLPASPRPRPMHAPQNAASPVGSPLTATIIPGGRI